jgi:hypothetical protein
MSKHEMYGGPLDGEVVCTLKLGDGGQLCLCRLNLAGQWVTHIYEADTAGKFRFIKTVGKNSEPTPT